MHKERKTAKETFVLIKTGFPFPEREFAVEKHFFKTGLTFLSVLTNISFHVREIFCFNLKLHVSWCNTPNIRIICRLSCLQERNEWRLPRGWIECSNSHDLPTIAFSWIHLLLWRSASIRSRLPEYLGSFSALCTLLSGCPECFNLKLHVLWCNTPNIRIIRRLSCLWERNEWRLPRGRMECSNFQRFSTICCLS